MKTLNEKEIQYGFYHAKNINIGKTIVEVSEYNSGDELIIGCTQLSD